MVHLAVLSCNHSRNKLDVRSARRPAVAVLVVALAVFLYSVLPLTSTSCERAFGMLPRRAAVKACVMGISVVSAADILGATIFGAANNASALTRVETKGSALGGTKSNTKAFERYVEKDPALPKFEVLRPVGWEHSEQTWKQNLWKDFGRTLTFFQGNASVEVALQPVGKNKNKVSDFGSPEDFANSFANSVARAFAPPSVANPSPVPKVIPLSMIAADDFTRLLARYRLEVGDRPSMIFEQLVGLAVDDTEASNYLYSLTAFAPEDEFDKMESIFAVVFRSFSISLRA